MKKFLEIYLEDEDIEKFNAWRAEQDKKSTPAGEKYPAYGAIGGAYTFHITYTTLGAIFTVSNAVTKEEIDLTNYNDW